MPSERHLRRKLTFKAHGRQVVFVKKKQERRAHVLMKAFLWALYLPFFPDLAVEVPIGDKYKPDVVSLDASTQPRFWGEAGKVGEDKIFSITRRYPRTHFALAKWDAGLEPFAETVRAALAEASRRAPFDLIRFPPDAETRFVDAKGRIVLQHDDVEWLRLQALARRAKSYRGLPRRAGRSSEPACGGETCGRGDNRA